MFSLIRLLLFFFIVWNLGAEELWKGELPNGFVISLKREMKKNEFCIINDELIEIRNGNVVKAHWSSFKNFSEFVNVTNANWFIEIDSNMTEKNKLETCKDFPGFYKIKILKSDSLKSFFNQDYIIIVFSSRLSSLFYFDQYKNKIKALRHFEKNVGLRNIEIDQQGYFVVDAISGKNKCILKFDVNTRIMTKKECD